MRKKKIQTRIKKAVAKKVVAKKRGPYTSHTFDKRAHRMRLRTFTFLWWKVSYRIQNVSIWGKWYID